MKLVSDCVKLDPKNLNGLDWLPDTCAYRLRAAGEDQLGWLPAWRLEEALRRIVEWHRRQRDGDDMRDHSLSQIIAYAGAPAA